MFKFTFIVRQARQNLLFIHCSTLNQIFMFLFWENTTETTIPITLHWGIVSRKPKSICKPHRVSHDLLSVLVAVPCVVSMCSILYIQYCMTKACLSKSWVARLRFRHAVHINWTKKWISLLLLQKGITCKQREIEVHTWLQVLQYFRRLQLWYKQEHSCLVLECISHLWYYMLCLISYAEIWTKMKS